MARQKKKPVKIWTLDTETRGLFGEVFRVGLYSEEQYHVGNNITDLLPIIENHTLTENHVYIHNLDFDLAKVFPDLKERIDFDRSLFINSKAVTVQLDTMVFHDSLSLLPGSLDRLSNDFGLTKNHKMDLTDYIKEQGYAIYNENGDYLEKESKGNFFENVPADDEILNEYLKLDCVSLYDIITLLCEISEIKPDKLVFCPTTASLALTVFKNLYKEEYKDAIKYKWFDERAPYVEEFIRASYCGGRTEVFRPFMKDGFHYDVNSLYPYVMKKFDFPFGFPTIYEGEKAGSIYETWKRAQGGAGFLKCTVDVPDMFIPPLPKKSESGKLLFPVGKFDGVFTFPELQFAESLGVKISDITEAVFFKETGSIFKRFVHKFEKIKMESTGAKRAFAKLCQNSLYGKFGMRRERTTYTNQENEEKAIDSGKPYRFCNFCRNMQNVSFIEYVTESKAKYIQPQIAAYVTSYARLELLKGLLQQEQAGEVYYCDTDSIAGSADMPSDMVDDKRYGAWKLESVIDEGIFLQPKLYTEKHKNGDLTIKAKGVPHEIKRDFDFETYNQWAKEMEHPKTKRIDIFEGLEARQKFLSSLKNNQDLETKRLLRKSINILATQKRRIDFQNNTSYPLTVDDFIFTEIHTLREHYKDIADLVTETGDNYIIMAAEAFGYPIPPESELYNSLTKQEQKTYFKKKGIPFNDFLSILDWTEQDFFYEISGGKLCRI